MKREMGIEWKRERKIEEERGLIWQQVIIHYWNEQTFITALVQASNKDKKIDNILSAITLIILSMPDFIIGTILLIVFVVTFPLLPAISLVDESSTLSEWILALIMPSVTLALVMFVYGVRMLRDNLIEVLI